MPHFTRDDLASGRLGQRGKDALAKADALGAAGLRLSSQGVRVGHARRPLRRGQEAEASLYAMLRAEWPEFVPGEVREAWWLRQYPFGSLLDPPRRWTADAAFPARLLLIEVEGQVHGIKGRRKDDIVREQAAQAAGWTVLRLLPSQVHDGTALSLIREALGSAKP